MSITNQSPFKVKELDVILPTMGKVKAFAHAKNNVVMAGSELPGFSEIHLPVDVLLNEPDIESKVNTMLYMLNEMDSCPPNAEFELDFDDGDMKFTINSPTNRVELQERPLFQVITRDKMSEAGMYDIHEDAIITQDKQLAKQMSNEMDNQSMVFPVNKKPSDLSPEESARVINDPKAGLAIAKLRDVLNRYRVPSFSDSRRSTELIAQSLMGVEPHYQNLIEDHFNKPGTVGNAINNLIIDQDFAPTPIPAYSRDQSKNSPPGLFTSITNNVSKGDSDNDYILNTPNDGVVIVSKDEHNQNKQENSMSMSKR